MSARTVRTAPATQRAKVRKQAKHLAPNNAFDRIQKSLQLAEEEARKTARSKPRLKEEWD